MLHSPEGHGLNNTVCLQTFHTVTDHKSIWKGSNKFNNKS